MQKARNYFKFFLFFLFFIVSSCLSRFDDHGYMFNDIDVEAVNVGFSDKKQVLAIFGSPTITLYHENQENWIYLSQKVRNLLFLMPKITERKVIILSFANGNVVSKINEISLEDQRDYVFDSHSTEIKDQKSSIFDSIFGNIGQVTPQ